MTEAGTGYPLSTFGDAQLKFLWAKRAHVRHTWRTSHSDSPGRWPLWEYVVNLTTLASFVNRVFVS